QVDTTLPRPKRTNKNGGVAWSEGAGGVGPTVVTVAGAGGCRRAAQVPALPRRPIRRGRPRLVRRWHRRHQPYPGEPARRLSGGNRRRPASRSAPSQPDGRDSPPAHAARGGAGRRRRPDPAGHGAHRAARSPSPGQSRWKPLAFALGTGAFRPTKRGPALRVGGGEL